VTTDKHCCSTALPEGWLVWTYHALRSDGPWYQDEDDALLYETLATCLDVDMLIFKPSGTRRLTRCNVVGPHKSPELSEGYWKDVENFSTEWKRVEGPNTTNLRLPTIPNGADVFARRIEVGRSGGDNWVLGVIGEPTQRVCERCFAQMAEFLRIPQPTEYKGPPHPSLELLPLDQNTWVTLRQRDPVSTLLKLKTQEFFQLLAEGARSMLPKEYIDEFKFYLDGLRRHSFGATVVFNQQFVLPGSSGFGYFLTDKQEDEIAERLGLENERGGAEFKRACWLLQGFEYASGGRQEGLVAAVTKRRQVMWARNFSSRAIYDLKEDLIQDTYLRSHLQGALGDDEATLVTATIEDIVVHRPIRGQEQNFLIELPFYAEIKGDEGSPSFQPIAALFLVLPKRPSASVLSLIVLCGRNAFRTAVLAAVCGLAPGTEASFGRQRWFPLLARGIPLGSDFLDTAFPRVKMKPFHDMEAIFKASQVKLADGIRTLQGAQILLEHHDTEQLVRLIQRSTDERMAQWAYFLLKMRVRSKQEGLQNDVYILDLLHYLTGWSAERRSNGAFKDLIAVLGRPRNLNVLPFASHTEIILSVSGFAGAEGDWQPPSIIARRERDRLTQDEPYSQRLSKSVKWRNVGDGVGHDAIVDNPWELPAKVWGDGEGESEKIGFPSPGHPSPLFWLKKARVRIPNYRTDDPAGAFGVFLGRLVERAAEQQPGWLHLSVRHDVRRLVVEALWESERSATMTPPAYLLPEDQRWEGGDMGSVSRMQHVPNNWTSQKAGCHAVQVFGWYVALPLKYEGGKPAFYRPQA